MLPTPAERSAMRRALALAARAGAAGDVPIGAVVIGPAGQILGEGYNRREVDGDPTAHAEIEALRAAGRASGNWRLEDATLVVTVEPCTMCAGAAVLARVKRIVFGAWEAKTGACGSVRDVVRDSRLNHRCQVLGGVLEVEASALLEGFFASHRN